jgi:hypothetical protein
MVVSLLRALPRPDPTQPAADLAPVANALAMVRALAPRDVLEAVLVQQTVVLTALAPQAAAMAVAHAGKPKISQRFERHGAMLTRRTLQLTAQLRKQQRQARAAAAAPPWAYDPAELEAIWQAGAELETPVAPRQAIAPRDVRTDASGPRRTAEILEFTRPR